MFKFYLSMVLQRMLAEGLSTGEERCVLEIIEVG